MGLYEDNKEIIQTSLLGQNSAEVNWNTFVTDIKDIIISSYDSSTTSIFKGNWKHAFNKAVSDLSLQVTSNDQSNVWNVEIEPSLKPTSETSTASSSSPELSTATTSAASFTASSSSPNYQRKLSAIDLITMDNIFSKISNKWILDNDRTVEDILHDISKKFSVEHPAQSYILDIRDSGITHGFNAEDLIEFKSKQFNFTDPFPPTLKEIIMKLNKKTTSRSIFDAINPVEAHPFDQVHEYWLKQSILNYALLFKKRDSLSKCETEQDLLDDVYGFIKTSCELSNLDSFGAKQSKASSESKNSKRSIGSINEEQRQQSAENADLYFRKDSTELFCLEIGLEDHGAKGTKEMNECCIKTPMMMKSFCDRLVTQFKLNPVDIKIAGVVISGLNITGLVMTFNNGSISLLSCSDRLRMPESVSEIPRLLPPVLNLIYNLNVALKDTVDVLDELNSSVVVGQVEPFYFPPCFVPVVQTTTSNKKPRKSTKENN